MNSPLYMLIQQFATSRNSAVRELFNVLHETGVVTFDRTNHIAGHFSGIGGIRSDYGFQSEFQDDHLYRDQWGIDTPASRQVGHFLSAVSMGLDNNPEDRLLWEYLIVRHEQFSDGSGLVGQIRGLGRQAIPRSGIEIKTAATSIGSFNLAVRADALGAYDLRDTVLEGIYNLGSGTPEGRIGNSMEDLRLSVSGWRLGSMVRNNEIFTSQEVANWLALYVAGN